MAWTTLSLEVSTPLFNGGADPDGRAGFPAADEPGVRVASVRGAMRFWFRALAGSLTGPDLRLLADLEQRVFGSTDSASPVVLRIPDPPPVVPRDARRTFLTGPRATAAEMDDDRRLLYLMGQGLGNMGHVALRRGYVAPGELFDLKIGFRHRRSDDEQARAAIETAAVAALWLTCAYGGVGARARRGFGGLRIAGADGPLPGPWDSESIQTPGLLHYQELSHLWPAGPVAASMAGIARLAGDRPFDVRNAWAGQPPSFPVLSRTHTLAATSGGEKFASWRDTLAYAGRQWRFFRASKENTSSRAQYQPRIETPEWPAVVHGGRAVFDIGALGLPVVYSDGYVVNAATGHGRDAEQLRRPSPLWMRAVGGADGWRLLSFSFICDFLPGPAAPRVHLWQNGRQGKELTITSDDVRDLTTKWINVLARDENFSQDHVRTLRPVQE